MPTDHCPTHYLHSQCVTVCALCITSAMYMDTCACICAMCICVLCASLCVPFAYTHTPYMPSVHDHTHYSPASCISLGGFVPKTSFSRRIQVAVGWTRYPSRSSPFPHIVTLGQPCAKSLLALQLQDQIQTWLCHLTALEPPTLCGHLVSR